MSGVPEVAVWADAGGNDWEMVNPVTTFTSLSFAPSFLEPGDWDMTLPNDAEAAPLTQRGVLVTVDFRGHRSTWTVAWSPHDDAEDGPVLTVAGDGALSLLGREVVYPDPLLPANQQYADTNRPNLYEGTAEKVVLDLIRDNYVTREGRSLHLPASQGRGLPSRARSNFGNLQEIVVKKARAGGIGVDVGLVNTTGATRARLEVRIWEPEDLSGDVILSELVGTLSEWGAEVTPPTLTKAIVAGAEGVYLEVTTPESEADAALWGGHRTALVSGRESYDEEDLVQDGTEALIDGASKVDVTLTASDDSGLVALVDYTPGSRATARLQAGLTVVDVISSVRVSVDESGTEVVPTLGNPDAHDPYADLAQLIRSQDRRLRAQEQRG